MDPTLDGSYVLGTACHVVHRPHPIAIQSDAFFGINGVVTLMGGSRGRMFEIRGIFVGNGFDDASALAAVMDAEAVLLSYADGITRTFTDTQGRSWPNVIFEGHYQPDPSGPRPCADANGYAWCLPFVCELRGLS